MSGRYETCCFPLQLSYSNLTLPPGCLVSFSFSERFGRKKPLFIGTTLVIAGAVIQTASYERIQFIVGRIVAGVGTGLNTSIIPIWYVVPSSMQLPIHT
jgi:MFS family permease